jgi:predicted RNA-binding Zn ribbon-like protein
MVTAASPTFELVGGSLALDFVNSQDRMAGKPWVEKLVSYADFLAWSAATGSLPRERLRRLAREAEARPREAGAVLARAREMREAAFRILSGHVAGEAPARSDLESVNAGLSECLAHARLARGERGLAWDWDPDPTDLGAPLWPVARALAELLVSPDLAHVKRCASETCLWLFLDATKNHQRRWCDMKVCGNRAKVRAHRKRLRSKRRRARGSPG